MEAYGKPSGALGRQVIRTSERIDRALKDYNTAIKTFKDGKMAAANEMAKRAFRGFPESRRVRVAFLHITGLFAFEQGTLDYYIEAHDLLGRLLPKDFEAVNYRALAIAARFYVKGNPEDRDMALALIKEAEKLASRKEDARFITEAFREVRRRLAKEDPRRFPPMKK
jgi:hypothetical protein